MGPARVNLSLSLHFPNLHYLLVSFTFLLTSSIFLLFRPFPFYQNSPTRFPGRILWEATEFGLCFFVLYAFFT